MYWDVNNHFANESNYQEWLSFIKTSISPTQAGDW